MHGMAIYFIFVMNGTAHIVVVAVFFIVPCIQSLAALCMCSGHSFSPPSTGFEVNSLCMF